MVKFRAETVIFIILLKDVIDAFDNTTEHYMEMDEEDLFKGRFLGSSWSRRKPRFLNIQKTKDDIAVRMEFGFQIITIPVKRVIDMATGMVTQSIPSIKISIETIAAALAVLLGTSVLAPGIANLFSFSHSINRENSNRALETNESLFDDNGDFVLPNSNLLETCTQRAMCSWVRKVSKRRDSGDLEDFLYTIINHKWMKSTSLFQKTKMADIISSGSNGESCSTKYSKCKINQKTIASLSKMMNNFFDK